MAPRETGPRDGRRVEGWAWRHRAHARTSASALIFCAELFVPSADLQAIHMKRLGARHPMIAGKMTTGRSAPAASAMRWERSLIGRAETLKAPSPLDFFTVANSMRRAYSSLPSPASVVSRHLRCYRTESDAPFGM